MKISFLLSAFFFFFLRFFFTKFLLSANVFACYSDETEYEYSGSDDDENHAQVGKPLDVAAGALVFFTRFLHIRIDIFMQ